MKKAYFTGSRPDSKKLTQHPARNFQELAESIETPVTLDITHDDYWKLPSNERGGAKQTKYVTPCTFPSSPWEGRKGEHAGDCYLLFIDVDNSDHARMLLGKLRLADEQLIDFNFVVWRTISSTPENPRLRVMVEAAGIPPHKYSDAVLTVAQMMGLPQVTRESLIASQPMYPPCVFKDHDDLWYGSPVIASHVDGRSFSVEDISTDTASFPPLVSGNKPATVSASKGDSLDDFLTLYQPPVEGVTLEAAKEALSYVSADCSRPEWLEMAAALKHQYHATQCDEAYTVFDEWSSTGSKYAGHKDTAKVWKSFKEQAQGRRSITIRSLLKRAVEGGWDGMLESNKCWLPAGSTANEKYENNENSHETGTDISCISSFSYGSAKPPRIPDSALYGPVGEIVRLILPHTEADPAALYAQLLAGLGNLIGPSPYFVADGSRHRANLFAIICGRTAKARKGTSLAQTNNILINVDSEWFSNRVKSGTVSGEGITQVFGDDGDKRLLLVEGEFAQVLQVMKREGNTVSVLLRQAWDGQRIAVLRRKDPIEVDGAHISLIGHITLPELRRLLASVEMSNGLANRCLWIHADRSKLLPEGNGSADTRRLCESLRAAVSAARERGEVQRDEAARLLWHEIYAELSEPPPGRMGEILSRAEAQVMRIALLLALLDQADFIGKQQLEAAVAFWRYCEASAAHIFAETFGDPRAAKIWEALGNGPRTLTQVHELFGRNASKSEIEAALAELAPMIVIETGGLGGGKVIRRKVSKSGGSIQMIEHA